MRLSRVKVAGFKSFVDPTTFELKSQLVGIVGPNGCGKSNIIDAVRWVMGESSAKNLRGESLTDVIFNGSQNRKPVGRVSVEMVFDNSDGSLGGEYASYAEIAIRRQATRDGKSDYFLNDTRCRKRDIQDVFAGTGLGPRSYSIIEQGMIARIIEAKPEELRSFIEEAAGISIYKKRRHQTELRMNHTQENLDRIADLLAEQAKTVAKLEKQAANAKKFSSFEQEKLNLELQISAWNWRELNQAITHDKQTIATVSNLIEALGADKTKGVAELEKLKLEHMNLTDDVSSIQDKFFHAGAKVARFEEKLSSLKARQQQKELDIQDLAAAKTRTETQITQDDANRAQLEADLALIEPELAIAETNLEQALASTTTSDQNKHAWQQVWLSYQKEVSTSQQTAEVEKLRIEELDRTAADSQKRLSKLNSEQAGISIASFDNELAELEVNAKTKQQEENTLRTTETQLTEKIDACKKQASKKSKIIDKQKLELQASQGRLSSLHALQQAATEINDNDVKSCLDNASLAHAKRVCELIKIDGELTKAVEAVLADCLNAVYVTELADCFTNDIANIQQGSLTVVTESCAKFTPNPNSLATKVTDAPQSILALLNNAYLVTELPLAMAQRSELAANSCFVTVDGILVGPNWLKIKRGDILSDGTIARAQEIEQLTATVDKLATGLAQNEQDLELSQKELDELEAERKTLQRTLHGVSKDSNNLAARLMTLQSRKSYSEDRLIVIAEETKELEAKLSDISEQASKARLFLEKALADMVVLNDRKDELLADKAKLDTSVTTAKAELNKAQQIKHELSLKQRTLLTKVGAITDGIARLTGELKLIAAKLTGLEQEDDIALDIANITAELNTSLDDRLQLEDELAKLKQQQGALADNIKTREREISKLNQDIDTEKESLAKTKLNCQSLMVRCETIEENTLPDVLQATVANLADDIKLEVLKNNLQTVNDKIAKLGPINLAAIDEFVTESERQQHLQAQHTDLSEALATLESAIRKIDKETRLKFKDTFEAVNSKFKSLYPRLFSGGKAYLEMTENDLLTTGITVMAHPPGKRNSSIHLLSGGEKALTAVALVFAIFELNPAPFCMLDEVDAPLDDANVHRYSNLLKQMAPTVQFIFITHNKITMAIAEHLSGVTMKEPGVSRIVQVDVAEAVAMSN